MTKLDLVQQYKSYYTAGPYPEYIETTPIPYLSIIGQGDPSGEAFALRVQTLYAVAYTLKFSCKAKNQDFAVPKLEALWWFDESAWPTTSISEAPLIIPREAWSYRLMIRLPFYIPGEHIPVSAAAVADKKSLPMANEVSYFILHEGRCVQILHVGPFDKEPETLQRLQEFIIKEKLSKNGLHHEIYLSDFRKTPPEKLKTILREPVR